MLRRRGGFVDRLAIVAIVGLAIRLAYVLIFRTQQLPFGGDASFYTLGATKLVGGYAFTEPLSPFVVVQSASHPPLYLLYLASAALVWPGHAPTQLVYMIWSCVLGTGSIVLIGLAAREIAGAGVGLIAAGLAALYPNVWVHDGMLLSETSAIFVSALVILLAYRFVHHPGWRRVFWLGAACGLAALARAELVLLVPLLIAPLVLAARGFDWRRRIAVLAVGGVAAAVVMAPWVVFNLTRFNTPVTLSTNMGGTLAAANCEATYFGSVIGYKDYGCAHEVFLAARRRNPNWTSMDPSEQDQAVRSESLRYVKAHLFRLPTVVLARLGRITHLYMPFQEVQFDNLYLRQETWVGYSIVWSFWGMALLAIGGVVLLRRARVPVWTLLAMPLVVCISVVTTFAQTRYRAPAEVSITILAAVSVDALVRRWRRRRAGHHVEPLPGSAAPLSDPDSSPALESSPS